MSFGNLELKSSEEELASVLIFLLSMHSTAGFQPFAIISALLEVLPHPPPPFSPSLTAFHLLLNHQK